MRVKRRIIIWSSSKRGDGAQRYVSGGKTRWFADGVTDELMRLHIIAEGAAGIWDITACGMADVQSATAEWKNINHAHGLRRAKLRGDEMPA